MPDNTTPTTPKKIARRQVKRVNGQLVVVYIDVATGQVITDLTGYSIEPDTSQGTNGGGTPTPTPTPTASTDRPTSAGGYSGGEYTGNGLANPSVGGKGTGGFMNGLLDVVDEGYRLITGKDTTRASGKRGAEDVMPMVPGVGETRGMKQRGEVAANANTAIGLTPSENLTLSPNRPGTTAKPADTSKDSIKAYLASRMAEENYPEVSIAAALAHAEHESGFNPTIEGDGGNAVGLFQWNNRRPAMEKWVTDNKFELGDPYGQVEFYLHELNATETKARDMLLNATNPYQANLGMTSYERFYGWNNNNGANERNERLRDTSKYLEQVPALLSVLPKEEEIAAPNGPSTLNLTEDAYNPAGRPKASDPEGSMADLDRWYTAKNAPNQPGYVSPTISDLMGRFNALPGVVPAAEPVVDPTVSAGLSGNPRNLDSGFGTPQPQSSAFQYPGQIGKVGMPADARPASLGPAPVSTFDQMLEEMVAAAGSSSDPAFAKAQTEAYLDTINESLGKPSWDQTFGGESVPDAKGHPNRKSWLDDGADFTTAAGYGGLTYPVWQQYAPKVGATDFSLENQKKVMLAVATDNYEAKTGRSLISDLISGNQDSVSSVLVNSSNIWKTLPGGPSASMPLPVVTSTLANRSESIMAGTIGASTGVTRNYVPTDINPMTVGGEPTTAQMSKPFAATPSTVVNSSGQVMNKSTADVMRSVNGTTPMAGAGFASKSGSSGSSYDAASGGSGFATKSASSSPSSGSSSKSYEAANGPSTSSSQKVTSATGGTITAGQKSAISSTTKPSTSAASAGASKAGSSASSSQKVTTATGSTITKAQADAIRRL